MDVILLERVEKLGQMGDVVKVRPGFARNFLLPRRKALRANEANRKIFEAQRADLEARNLERRKDAEAVAAKLDGRKFTIIRQASELGHLYGSVTTRDIAEAASASGVKVDRTQVRLDKPLKMLGISPLRVMLHPEVSATIEINIARSEEEAERQARGENVLVREESAAKPAETGAEFFDEGAMAPIEKTESEPAAR
jgi:large subunit ribosomal protein L9